MHRVYRLLTVTAFLLHASAFAQQGPVPDRPQAPRDAPGGRRPGKPPAVFLSPVGKPYRAPPDGRYPIVDWFAAIDANGDGFVTASEFEAEATVFFAELDANGDGEIDPDEINRYETQIAPEVQAANGPPPFMPGGMGGDGPPGGKMPGGGPPGGMGGGPPGGMGGGPSKAMLKRMLDMPRGAAVFSLIALPEPLTAADTNMNRGVTLDELHRAARLRFRQLDGANKGKLALTDLSKTPIEQMMHFRR